MCQHIDMVCIYCRSDTVVTNSRHQKRVNYIWRRRQCLSCRGVFTSIESPKFAAALVVQKEKALEAFSRDKLFLSLYESLKHRKTALADATALTDTVMSKLYSDIQVGSIKNEQIINATLPILKRFDKAAATYYQAYHQVNN